jgi:hypothetical protein
MVNSKLQSAIDAIRAITDIDDMHVIVQEYNRQVNFLRKTKGRSVVLGDIIVWRYGGIEKTGKVVKVNRVSVEVVNTGATPFGATRTKVDKSLITGKVAA